MPHLSPMNWIIFMTMLWIIIMIMSSNLWWNRPKTFYHTPKKSHYKTNKWLW